MKNRVVLILSLVALIGVTGRTSAQIPQQSLQTELRADGLFARSAGFEAGIGISVPTGIYVRNGVVGGIGFGRHGLEGRTDLLSRFSLDPFRQSRWALYGGGGISGRYRASADGGSHAYLMLVVGLEGPLPDGHTSGWVPIFEAALGGGARVGIGVRRGINARR